jgi:hypothetical protein
VLTRSILFFFVHAQFLKIKCNQGMNERTNQQSFSPANFVYRPQARGGLEAGGGRSRPVPAYAVDD